MRNLERLSLYITDGHGKAELHWNLKLLEFKEDVCLKLLHLVRNDILCKRTLYLNLDIFKKNPEFFALNKKLYEGY